MPGLPRGGVSPGDEAQAELPGRPDRDVGGVSGGAVAEGDHPGKWLCVPARRLEDAVYHPLGESQGAAAGQAAEPVPAVAVPLAPVAALGLVAAAGAFPPLLVDVVEHPVTASAMTASPAVSRRISPPACGFDVAQGLDAGRARAGSAALPVRRGRAPARG